VSGVRGYQHSTLSIPDPLMRSPRLYLVLRTIGKGSFGCRKLAYHCLTGTQVVVKIQEKGEKHFLIASEISLLKTLHHPNIIKLLQVIKTVNCIYLVMEHVSGGLSSYCVPINPT
jgi:serine/threonine protein kinase